MLAPCDNQMRQTRSEQLMLLFIVMHKYLNNFHNLSRLNILTWNPNSVLPKTLEFFDFLLQNSIDVAPLNETHLKQGTGL
jgi:hypothetical protein